MPRVIHRGHFPDRPQSRIIEFCEGLDYVTQDMVIQILHDEEGHRRLFEGFLREFDRS